MHVGLAALTAAGSDAPRLSRVVTDVLVDDGTVEVVWARDASRTRVSLEPLEVRHTRP